MNQPFAFKVPGIPRPAGSKKGFPFKRRNGSLGVAITDASKHSRPWKDRVTAIAMTEWKRPVLDEPITLQLMFVMPRPAGHYGKKKGERYVKETAPYWHTIAPDTTKLIRAVEDALTGIVWRDDSLVVWQAAFKRYGDEPGVTVIVNGLPEDSNVMANLPETARA